MSDELPIGAPAPETPVARPFTHVVIGGRSVDLVPLDPVAHGQALYDSFARSDPEARIWTYMGQGPFADYDDFRRWLDPLQVSFDPLFFTIVPRETGTPAGMGAFLRSDIDNGVAEIGNIWFSPTLQRSRAASEAIYLMMRHVLDTQACRRLEWKCNALNAASRRAAVRFGFEFEGVFRNHMIVKGRNRDTAWYAIVTEDWPPLRAAFETWLDDANFDASGIQKTSLGDLTRAARKAQGD